MCKEMRRAEAYLVQSCTRVEEDSGLFSATHNQLKWQPLGLRAHERKACGQAARWAARGQRTCFGKGKRSRARDGFISNLNGN